VDLRDMGEGRRRDTEKGKLGIFPGAPTHGHQKPRGGKSGTELKARRGKGKRVGPQKLSLVRPRLTRKKGGAPHDAAGKCEGPRGELKLPWGDLDEEKGEGAKKNRRYLEQGGEGRLRNSPTLQSGEREWVEREK